MATVLSRGARRRRGGRRPGWTLLTALLVLAIGASSALVFTSRVELLKLAVVLALWAAVMAAFVSVIYRRQSDADQARVRDLKLVYDLQLDREISARREYELTVESQLRRELASELRAQAADEVAALRAELTALRTNLEILFDADLGQRPALETERTTVRAHSDWARPEPDSMSDTRVMHATAVRPDDAYPDSPTTENPIIDVPEVRVPAGGEPAPPPRRSATGPGDPYQGSHRRAADDARSAPRRPAAEPRPRPAPAQPAAPEMTSGAWQPIPAEGQWLPPGTPGSNWVADPVPNEPAPEPGRRRRGRHADPAEPVAEATIGTEPPRPYTGGRRRAGARHSAEHDEPGPAPTPAGWTPPPDQPSSPGARHADTGPGTDGEGPPTGGQSVADLLARLQPDGSGGRRRRRRAE